MNLMLYNTQTRQKEHFEPIQKNRVQLYLCGPTVYNYAHIGNARAALVGDMLVRLLKCLYKEVFFIRNITDIDDRIILEAQKKNITWQELTRTFEEIYFHDMAQLGLLTPDVCPRASEHIDLMISMIQSLLEKGYAYEVERHILFSVSSFSSYGLLSHRNRQDMLEGARIEVAPFKRDGADFVLWKPGKSGEPSWESPWGLGRPGWHIECSAMIKRYAGETLDVHMGGQDLIFPHHENECAQSICAHAGKPLARFWVHNAFINIRQEKMSKSLGNTLLVHELLKQADGIALRFALLNTHYRHGLEWNDDTLIHAQHNVSRLLEARAMCLQKSLKPLEKRDNFLKSDIFQALCDDLNTPLALGKLMTLAKSIRSDPTDESLLHTFLFMFNLLGFDTIVPQKKDVYIDKALIETKIQERLRHRKNKNFQAADRIRQELQAMGIRLEDTSEEDTIWFVNKA